MGFLSSWIDGVAGLHGIQVFSVFLAGILTGAGQKRGVFYGAFVALCSCLMFQWFGGAKFAVNSLPARAAELLLLVSCGAAGGLAGSVAWQTNKPSVVFAPKSEGTRNRPTRSAYEGPVAWMRVCMGIPLAVGGVMCAQFLREALVDMSNGRLVIDSYLQADFVAWEISALAILAGSAFAGATCSNGLKQGFFVGIGTATALLGIRLASPHMSLGFLIVTVVAAICLSVTGGWFGSQLLPPVVRAARRRQTFSTVYSTRRLTSIGLNNTGPANCRAFLRAATTGELFSALSVFGSGCGTNALYRNSSRPEAEPRMEPGSLIPTFDPFTSVTPQHVEVADIKPAVRDDG